MPLTEIFILREARRCETDGIGRAQDPAERGFGSSPLHGLCMLILLELDLETP